MSLEYEPSSEPLHISAEHFFLNREPRTQVQDQIRLGETLRKKQLQADESGESSDEDMDVDKEIADNKAPLPKATGVSHPRACVDILHAF